MAVQSNNTTACDAESVSKAALISGADSQEGDSARDIEYSRLGSRFSREIHQERKKYYQLVYLSYFPNYINHALEILAAFFRESLSSSSTFSTPSCILFLPST
jgi:hypothetical protein